ncbi:hypothetical protein RIF29_18638 [Crotalaria pallida]|uniref:Diphosphomevalonate decarboxylase n=1 Tax=Crotalaria pallida TaxID=3830 RepID=A0AAN9F0B4_CROPI
MANGTENWVMMVTAQTPTNIAVIKYWGKRDETLILPVNDSISVTLDPAHLCTTTTIAVSPTFQQDRMWLNGKVKQGIELNYGLTDWFNLVSEIQIAGSIYSLGKLMNLKEDESQLSAIARQGSGSACRSLYGGFVKWIMGKEENGSDSVAVQLADEKHWDDLVIIIAVVSSRQKETSSTSGMRETVETSLLLQHRAKEIVPKRILQMEEAIRNRDFASFSQLTSISASRSEPPDVKYRHQAIFGD